MSKPILIYFPARGRAELIRLILAEAGVDYDEHPVLQGTPPQNGRPTDFAALKASGLLPFAAVPVWIEPDGFHLAQSFAIANHVARNHGLRGKTAREAAECDQMLGAFDDLRGEMRKLVTTPAGERPALRAELASSILPRWLGYLDKILAANHGGEGFVVGDSISLADLALWYLLEIIRDSGWGAVVDRYPRLAAFATRISQRPRIKEYAAAGSRRHPFTPFPT